MRSDRNGAKGAARLIVLLGSAAFSLGGCTASLRGEPVNPFSPPAAHAGAGSGSLPVMTPPDWLSDTALLVAHDSTTVFTQDQRNEIVTARMYILDLAYGEFEGKLLAEVHQSGFGTALTSLVLTTGATAIGDPDAKTALSALATVVNGGKTSFSKEILAEQTVQTLIGFMQSRRAQIRAQIIERLKRPYADWPMGLALSDLQAYYRAGTLTGAFLTANESSATDRKAADEKADRTLKGYDERGAEQTQVSTAILACFAQVPGTSFDTVVADAAQQGLFGSVRDVTLKFLTSKTHRGTDKTIPTETQRKTYVSRITHAVPSENDRAAQLTLHRQAVCKLAPPAAQ